jgi:hypothetical protein
VARSHGHVLREVILSPGLFFINLNAPYTLVSRGLPPPPPLYKRSTIHSMVCERKMNHTHRSPTFQRSHTLKLYGVSKCSSSPLRGKKLKRGREEAKANARIPLSLLPFMSFLCTSKKFSEVCPPPSNPSPPPPPHPGALG